MFLQVSLPWPIKEDVKTLDTLGEQQYRLKCVSLAARVFEVEQELLGHLRFERPFGLRWPRDPLKGFRSVDLKTIDAIAFDWDHLRPFVLRGARKSWWKPQSPDEESFTTYHLSQLEWTLIAARLSEEERAFADLLPTRSRLDIARAEYLEARATDNDIMLWYAERDLARLGVPPPEKDEKPGLPT
jgi:hypothetical protein